MAKVERLLYRLDSAEKPVKPVCLEDESVTLSTTGHELLYNFSKALSGPLKYLAKSTTYAPAPQQMDAGSAAKRKAPQ